ncbi:IS1 family transposase [Escherichia coli]|nr:IS1 family transposase [Escherichia coli]MCY0146033.1 IS1 family transposase [Escherichia coli]
MGSCAAPSAKGDDKFITTDYLQQCPKGDDKFITTDYLQQCLSKSVELHDKVIGHYLNIKHYQ